MRAGVLSDEQIISFLNENFINTWVPNAELGRIRSLREPIAKRRERESKTFDTSHELAQTIIKGWKTGTKKGSPVDCFVISPEFELMGRLLVNDLDDDRKNRGLPSEEAHYLTFLNEALEEKQPGLGNIVLSREHRSREVSDVFRPSKVENHCLTVVLIDARSFENGGTLTIDIIVGREEGEGLFYLFDGDHILSKEGKVSLDSNLAWTWGEPDDRKEIVHRFNRGQFFKFVATGDRDANRPYINAFHAKFSVEENSNGDTKTISSTELNVVLDSTQPSLEILDIFRAPGHGNQDYTVVNIDTTAFDNGGMLTIDIHVGSAKASGSFDLYDGNIKLPTKGMPKEAFGSAWGIEPGKNDTITHRFEKGIIFKLGATGDWFSKKGSINAFHAKISVEEN